MDEKWRRLAGFYRELDAELERLGPECRGCGECCRFDRVDHILYASDFEREYLLRISAAPEPSGGDVDLLSRGLRCPFQRDDGCTARDGRVLGCRLHFCEGLGDADEEEFCEDWHNRLKALHAELGLDWNYRPLLPL